MHLELRQTNDGHWYTKVNLGEHTFATTPEYPTRLALDDELAKMAKSLGEGGAARIPVVTVHEHGGQVVLGGAPGIPDDDWQWVWAARGDGALHARAGATEFASLADWLPQGE